MKLAVMQPYLFPYIGYFQLIQSADKFVFYDDVAFIKQGWINRNNILLNEKAHLFSVPVKNISSFEQIRSTSVSYHPEWRSKFLKMIHSAYFRAPYFQTVYELIARVVEPETISVADLARRSVMETCAYVGLDKEFVATSAVYGNGTLKSEARIIDIAVREKADIYNNMLGGADLYSRENFAASGVKLQFIKPILPTYEQLGAAFVPGLSIMDVMMFNSPGQIRNQLNAYEIV